jgi:methylmalonyl-CoA mutase N-terminal domain/subunit
MVEAIEQGYPQREIADSAYRSQQAVETGEQTIVGVNRYTEDAPADIPILQIDEQVERDQVARVADLRDWRDAVAAARTLDALRRAAAGPENLMPFILDAVRAYVTVGEMCDALRDVWGEYEETPGI